MTEFSGYDVIGDVHGKADKLWALLTQLGYHQQQGAFRHPERQAIFVGDLIDNGRQTRAVLETVKAMADAGTAQVIMGNHELNAVGYATRHTQTGEFLRPHTAANQAHHQAFLDDLPTAEERRPWLDWFKTLPLFLDLPEFRVIHACWHAPSFPVIEPLLTPARTLRGDAWEAAFATGEPTFEAVESLLKGVEIPLPEQLSFTDHKGYPRRHARVAWWRQDAQTLADLVRLPSPRTTNRQVLNRLARYPADQELLQQLAYQDHKPVFFGHYWLHGSPRVLSSRAACTDYSAGGDGPLVGYRFDGEAKLSDAKLVWTAT